MWEKDVIVSGAKVRSGRNVAFQAFLWLLFSLVGCSDDQTTIIQIVDCGLERLDLLGEWTISFDLDVATLLNCSPPPIPPPFDGTTVTVGPPGFIFSDISVFASASNVGFQFQDSSSPNLLIGNVEADSCLMLFSFLDVDDSQYLQCIGTFDIGSGSLLGGCDSTAVVDDPLVPSPVIVSDCDLDPILAVTLILTP